MDIKVKILTASLIILVSVFERPSVQSPGTLRPWHCIIKKFRVTILALLEVVTGSCLPSSVLSALLALSLTLYSRLLCVEASFRLKTLARSLEPEARAGGLAIVHMHSDQAHAVTRHCCKIL